MENDTDYGKRAAEVESMESLDDPDDFFGCATTESIKNRDWNLSIHIMSKLIFKLVYTHIENIEWFCHGMNWELLISYILWLIVHLYYSLIQV